MKRYFLIGLSVLLLLSVGLIFYGAWLNNRGEYRIMQSMKEHKLSLPGASVERRDIYPTIKFNEINLYSNNMVDAVALIDGRIVESFAPKNARVSQGDVIFKVVNENIDIEIKEAKAGILEASAQLKQAENVYERQKLLFAKRATAAAKVQEAETSYLAAEARLETAQAKLDQLIVQKQRQDVIAPISGKVLMLYRQKGAHVDAGTSLALIGDFSALNFSISLEDKFCKHLKIGQNEPLIFGENEFHKIYNTNYEAGNNGDKQRFTATVSEIPPPLDEPANIRSVILAVDNSSGILEPQTYNAVSLESHSPYNCLTVPMSALIDSEKTEVFVVTPYGTIEKRKIQTGVEDGEFIEVIDGLKEGEVVVIHDKVGLTDGMAVEVNLESYGGGEE